MSKRRAKWAVGIPCLGLMGAGLACNVLDQATPRDVPRTNDTLIYGNVWLDADRNGTFSLEEKQLKGVRVFLRDQTGKTVAETTTGIQGFYRFGSVQPGTYVVAVEPPGGMAFSVDGAGPDRRLDSDILPTSQESQAFRFDGRNQIEVDAGLVSVEAGTTSPPPSTPSDAMAATAAAATIVIPQNFPQFRATYQHTVPGEYSEIVITFSDLAAGQEISGVVTGPKVDGDGSFTAIGGADGTAMVKVKILRFGDYQVEVEGVSANQIVHVVAATPTPF